MSLLFPIKTSLLLTVILQYKEKTTPNSRESVAEAELSDRNQIMTARALILLTSSHPSAVLHPSRTQEAVSVQHGNALIIGRPRLLPLTAIWSTTLLLPKSYPRSRQCASWKRLSDRTSSIYKVYCHLVPTSSVPGQVVYKKPSVCTLEALEPFSIPLFPLPHLCSTSRKCAR